MEFEENHEREAAESTEEKKIWSHIDLGLSLGPAAHEPFKLLTLPVRTVLYKMRLMILASQSYN